MVKLNQGYMSHIAILDFPGRLIFLLKIPFKVALWECPIIC